MNPPERPPSDAESPWDTTSRRHLLELMSAVGLAGLSGCSAIPGLDDSDTASSPSRISRQVSETDSAQRYREVVSSVEEHVDSPFGKVTFNYEPIHIDPSSSTDRQVLGTVRAAPSDAGSGDRMWISSGNMDIRAIGTFMRATLKLKEQIRVTANVLDSEVQFTGSKTQNDIYGLVAHHQSRDAVLVVRARDQATVRSLAKGYEESSIVPV